jgi:glycosyltransferase involved in cell wall biosynthesis
VIATPVGSNPQLVTEGRVILVPGGDKTAWRWSWRTYCKKDNLRVQLGEECRSFAQENFTMEQMRRRHEELYTELLARKGWSARAQSGRH